MLWSTIRALGNSKVVQASILIPILAYLILFSDVFNKYLNDNTLFAHSPTDMAGADHLSTILRKISEIKLFTMYFGFTAIGIGSAVYQLFCPVLIKAFRDADEYVQRTLANISDVDVELIASKTNVFQVKPDFDVRSLNDRIFVLRSMYGIEDRTKFPARVMSYCLYCIGFALLAIPAASTFVRVCRITASKLAEG